MTSTRIVRTPGDLIREIAVVIPANDEEARLEACLSAMESAVARFVHVFGTNRPGASAVPPPGIAVRVLVVLDDCSDGSAEIVARHPSIESRPVSFRNVGLARGYGVMAAIEGSADDPRTLWIANTDADSTVPEDWLLTQIAAARAGAELLVGSVRPNLGELTIDQSRAWRARDSIDTSLHVHGANLGFRADRYLEAGGFPPDEEHEDVLLVERLVRLGVTVVATAASRVRTSARTVGRTPGGFSEWVRLNY